MIDTHCHLEKKDYDNIDEIIKKCKENGVEKIIVSGYDVNSCKEMLGLAQKYDNVFVTLGYLPEGVDNITNEDIDLLDNMLKSDKVVGVGEIGLDYHYKNDDKEKQEKLFIEQLRLAKKHKLPVVIHSRDSINDTYEILKKENINNGTMHCYSGSLEYAYKFVELGLYLSIGGVSTFKNAKEIKKVILNIDIEHLLLETDSPYLTPEPYRGKKNYPYYIPIIAKNISEIKKIDLNIVEKQINFNTHKLFDI